MNLIIKGNLYLVIAVKRWADREKEEIPDIYDYKYKRIFNYTPLGAQ